MGLFDSLESGRPPAQRQRCTVSVIREKLAEDDAAQLDRLLALTSEQMPATEIGRVLRQNDMAVGNHVLTRHRRGDCSCPRA